MNAGDSKSMSDEKSTGIGEHARALREDFAPDKLEGKLQEVAEERPKTKHLLDFSIVGKALLAAVVTAVVLWLLVSAQIAAIALVVVFVGGWLLLAQLSYDRRRETRDADSAEPEPSGYEGDRGEVEAEREQEAEAPSRNGSVPSRDRSAT
jgi:Flp pilus assembly protein TadB